jgi:hypothetical protein
MCWRGILQSADELPDSRIPCDCTSQAWAFARAYNGKYSYTAQGSSHCLSESSGHLDHDLADVLLAFEVLVRLERLLKPKHAVDDGLERVDLDQAVHLPEPACASARPDARSMPAGTHW